MSHGAASGNAAAFCVIFRGAFVILVFLLVKPGKRFVQLGAIGIIFYSAFEEIFAECEIFTLRFNSQRLVRLTGIVHRGDAGVPRHVPCRRVPKQEHAWLERRDLLETTTASGPIEYLPKRHAPG